MGRGLWILSQPRVGSMYLCEVLNRTGLFGAQEFQERFFFEPYFLRNLRIGENSSSIRLNKDVLWLDDVAEIRSKKFRRMLLTLLYGGEKDVEAATSSPLFSEYRQALHDVFVRKGLPDHLKIHRRHFFAFLGDDVLDEPRLRSHFESKDYILLDRADRVAQAVSLYIAYVKNQVIVTDETRASWEDGSAVSYDENYLLMLYDMLNLPVRLSWMPFVARVEADLGATVARLDYERLCTDPADCVFDVLHEKLGRRVKKAQIVAAVNAVKLRSSERPESGELKIRLREALRRRSESAAH